MGAVPLASSGALRSELARVGEVTPVLEARDSQSGEILARAGDRRDPSAMGNTNMTQVSPALVRADTQRLFRYWAEIMRDRLDELRGVER